MPDNAGERRECLTILEKVDWKDGLLAKLVTDAEVSTRFTYFVMLSGVRALWDAVHALLLTSMSCSDRNHR